MSKEQPRSGALSGEESATSANSGPPGSPALPEAPNAEKVASGEPAAWPPIPEWMENPLVFRDANLGIVLVAGPVGDQMIYRIIGSPQPHGTPESSRLSGWMWVSVRKVDGRDGFQFVEALNLPNPISLPPVTVEALSPYASFNLATREALDAIADDPPVDRRLPFIPPHLVNKGPIHPGDPIPEEVTGRATPLPPMQFTLLNPGNVSSRFLEAALAFFDSELAQSSDAELDGTGSASAPAEFMNFMDAGREYRKVFRREP